MMISELRCLIMILGLGFRVATDSILVFILDK